MGMDWISIFKAVKPEIPEVIALSIDAALLLFLYNGYKDQKEIVQALQNSVSVPNDGGLKKILAQCPEREIGYGVIEGVVQPVQNAIDSKYIPNMKGVLQKLTLTEHGIRWSETTRLWLEDARTVDATVNKVAFSIIGSDGHKILVEPSTIPSDVPRSMLNFSHSEYKDVDQSALTHIADWATGYKPKGIKSSEKLLVVGSKVVAMGKLVNERGVVKLLPPDAPAELQLGTNINKTNLLSSANAGLNGWRVVSVVVGLVGCGIVAYMIHKSYERYRKWKVADRIRSERQRRNREAAQAHRSGTGAADEVEEDQLLCVVCKEQAREIMLRDCGHVCLCLDCFNGISDNKCPVCRGRITGYNQAFIP